MDNKQALAQRFGKQANSYHNVATVQHSVARHLMELALPFAPQRGEVFEVGCGTGFLSLPMTEAFSPSRITICDLSEAMTNATRQRILDFAPDQRVEPMVADAETTEWPHNQDVVASASAVQWFDDPLSFVARSASSLRPAGILMLATYGPRTFAELRGGEPDREAYPTDEQWQAELEKQGFAILKHDHTMLQQDFGSRMEMLRHIVLSGVGEQLGTKKANSLNVGVGPCSLSYETMWYVAQSKEI